MLQKHNNRILYILYYYFTNFLLVCKFCIMKTNISSISEVKLLNFWIYNQKKLFTILKKYVSKKTKILLTVSGGVDSIFLSCLVYSFFYGKKFSLDNFFVIHCHHWVRDESDAEEKFICDFFSDLAKNLFVSHYLGNKKTEQDLRKWRYSEFGKIAEKVWADYVLLGHHLNDRVESSFLHLLRGAGISWFLAMKECEKHYLLWNKLVLRPILWINKNYILDFCKTNWIPFMTDESNFDSSVSKRNYLRNEILPLLFELSNKNGNDWITFLESMQNVYLDIENWVWFDSFDLQNYVDKWILKKKSVCKYWDAKWNYQLVYGDKKDWLLTANLLAWVLRVLWVTQNITKKILEELVFFLWKKESWYKYWNGVYFFISHWQIYLINAEKDFWQNFEFWKKVSQKLFGEDWLFVWRVIDWKNIVNFDSYNLQISKKYLDWKIRYPKFWDFYKWKTWNKWCINQKIPVFWRKFIPVLELDGKIVFVFDNIIV